MNVCIVSWFGGGVVMIERLCSLVIVMFNVCGIGVVVSVSRCMLVCMVFSVFFWCMLKCCFLLIIIRFRFLNFMFGCSRWWVLMIMLIVLVVIFFSLVLIFLLVLNCDSIFICSG